MINNINHSTILFFAAGIVAVVFYFYFKKKQPYIDHVLLLVCGIIMILIAFGFQFFADPGAF